MCSMHLTNFLSIESDYAIREANPRVSSCEGLIKDDRDLATWVTKCVPDIGVVQFSADFRWVLEDQVEAAAASSREPKVVFCVPFPPMDILYPSIIKVKVKCPDKVSFSCSESGIVAHNYTMAR